jgi:hypothetical protein
VGRGSQQSRRERDEEENEGTSRFGRVHAGRFLGRRSALIVDNFEAFVDSLLLCIMLYKCIWFSPQDLFLLRKLT